MCVDVFQSLHDLEKDALDTRNVKTFVVSSFHELVKIAIHIFHSNVKLLGEGVEENVQCRHEMLMIRKRSQKYDLSKL